MSFSSCLNQRQRIPRHSEAISGQTREKLWEGMLGSTGASEGRDLGGPGLGRRGKKSAGLGEGVEVGGTGTGMGRKDGA